MSGSQKNGNGDSGKETERESRICAAVAKLEARGFLVDAVFCPLECLAIIAQIQLALRHPGQTAPTVRLGVQLAQDLISRLAENDTLLGQDLFDGFDSENLPALVGAIDIEEQWLVKPGAGTHLISDATRETETAPRTPEIHEGRGDVGNIVCPHCDKVLSIVRCNVSGEGYCDKCKGKFFFSAGPSPVGYAWQTWKTCPWSPRGASNG